MVERIAGACEKPVADQQIDRRCDTGHGQIVEERFCLTEESGDEDDLDGAECQIIMGNRLADGAFLVMLTGGKNG